MKFSVLGSSSGGNATYLEHNGKKYLIDCGFGIRYILSRMNDLNIKADHLDGIFISHEHSDHIAGLSSVSNHFNSPIFMSKKTYKGLRFEEKEKISPILLSFFNSGEEFTTDSLKVFPFPVSHDASDPVGFKFTDENEKTLVYLTDTGCFISYDKISNADAYIIESNHEPEMLLLSNRPWVLKNRILSDSGHLSNDDSAKTFGSLMGDKTKLAVLFHLSNECNTKELATLAYENYFHKFPEKGKNVTLKVSSKNHPTEIFEV
ncbi:MAG: MBL fold metallo-hydrolase [Bacillales bacterium]|nr:MBL fold metallo-hydrolase [Bacillales bacterium]